MPRALFTARTCTRGDTGRQARRQRCQRHTRGTKLIAANRRHSRPEAQRSSSNWLAASAGQAPDGSRPANAGGRQQASRCSWEAAAGQAPCLHREDPTTRQQQQPLPCCWAWRRQRRPAPSVPLHSRGHRQWRRVSRGRGVHISAAPNVHATQKHAQAIGQRQSRADTCAAARRAADNAASAANRAALWQIESHRSGLPVCSMQACRHAGVCRAGGVKACRPSRKHPASQHVLPGWLSHTRGICIPCLSCMQATPNADWPGLQQL